MSIEDFSKYNGEGTKLRDAQQCMLGILVQFDKICRKNNIVYWLDGGTLLGAVRHKGFIPWDDDIDISLLKEDYLRLLELIKNDKDFYLYFDDFSHHCCSFVYCKSDIWQSVNDSYFPNLYPVKLPLPLSLEIPS